MKLVQIALIIVCVVGMVIGFNGVTWSGAHQDYLKIKRETEAFEQRSERARRRGYRLVGVSGELIEVRASESERKRWKEQYERVDKKKAKEEGGNISESVSARAGWETRRAIQEQEELEKEAEKLRLSKITNVHPDYQKISNDQKFNEFINSLPEEDRGICNSIVGRGSAEEVNALLSAYKLCTSNGQGNASVQFNIGVMYDKGQGHSGAARWYLKAAEKGHASAQNNLGFMYYMGQGVDRDYNEAAKWYLKAAELKHVQAQFSLGFMYSKGQGVDQDYNKAVEWYRKAANQKYAHAQNMLGSLYSKGQGVDQDYGESVKWYRMAAEQGNKKAQKNLSTMYSEGRGVEKNEKEAVKWKLKSIEKT